MILELIEAQIGQDATLAGIRDFLRAHRYQGPPYATVIDLQEALVAQTASETKAQTVRDLFSQVLTFQVGVADATYRPLPNGDYEVSLTVEAQRFRTSGLGQQAMLPLNLPVEIELSDERDHPP